MKKSIFLTVLLAAFFVSAAIADPGDTLWTRTYGGSDTDYGRCVQQTTDGGYVITGQTKSFGAGYYDMYLIKTDVNGDTLWTRTHGGSAYDVAEFVQQTDDGGYIIVGNTASFGAGLNDVYLIKTDANGDTLWTRTYGGTSADRGYSVQQTSDGGYIIGGYTESFGAGGKDFYLVKTDANGDTLWTRTYGGSVDDYAEYVEQTNNGGYIIGGVTESFGAGGEDFYLVKTDADGDTLWTRTYGGSNSDFAYSGQQTDDGGYIIVGNTGTWLACDVWLVKTDATGDTLWTRRYNRSSSNVAYSGQQTDDGGYIITGYTGAFGSGFDVYLIKTDATGDTVWTRTYGGLGSSEIDYGRSVRQTDDGGYIVAGETSSFGAGGFDVYLLKIAGERLMVDFDIKPQSCPNPLNVRPYYNDEHGPRGALPTAILGTEDFDVNDIDPTTVTLEGVSSLRWDYEDVAAPVVGPQELIDPTTVTLEGVSPLRWDYEDVAAPVVDRQEVCDCTEEGPDGYVDLTLKFSRAEIIAALGSPPNGELPLTVAGTLYDGTAFEGVDCVVIINSPYITLEKPRAAIPESYVLKGNVPNPFNATTTITYGLPEAGQVSLKVYNLMGQEVATLVDGKQEAGYSSVTWNAGDKPSGIYFYRIQAGDFTESVRMILVK